MKTIILLGSIFFVFITIGANSEVLIPEDALRLRILANSNTEYDQSIKDEVSVEVENTLSSLLKDSQGVNDSREIINENMYLIEHSVNKVFLRHNYTEDFTISYGLNYFPEKEYKGVIYDEGEYESLLITLGSGKGDNWWCVLYPPLCMIEAEGSTEIEYKSYVKEIINEYF